MLTKYLLIVYLAAPIGDIAWLPVQTLGNPFATVRECGAARARFETASGGVGHYDCIIVKVLGADSRGGN